MNTLFAVVVFVVFLVAGPNIIAYWFNVVKGKIKTSVQNCTNKHANEYHREDGPAIEHANGDKHWYINGKRHRENGPAIEHANGDKCWYINGKRHRENGPAVIEKNNKWEWWVNGERHRTTGPAVVFIDGTQEYWVNGEHLSEQQFNEKYLSDKEMFGDWV